MLNIVVPMAGRGKRFAEAGYDCPKPLIPIHGRPMTQVVIDNLRPSRDHRFVFLILREHAREFGLDSHLRAWAPGCEVRFVESVTEGAACTILLARELIDSGDPLMIGNCDQWVDIDIDDYLGAGDAPDVDGVIMTMESDDPKWSFVRFDAAGRVVEVVEKRVVSNEATVGIYNFRRGSEFIRSAAAMIAKNLRVNDEFYVAPAYNELIAAGQRLQVYNVGRDGAGMCGLGTPTDLERFVNSAASRRAVQPVR